MKEIIVSAPGKVILHGEHSVVYGKLAVAAGVNLRTFLRLREDSLGEVRLHLPDVGLDRSWKTEDLQHFFSERLCNPLSPSQISDDLMDRLKEFSGISLDSSNTGHLAIIAFLYLYGSLAWKNGKCISMDVAVSSTQPVGAGLGSSASFSVCLAAGLLSSVALISPKQPLNGENTMGTWSEKDKELINSWAFEGERVIHGKPSGIDNSMATYGGALTFQSGKIVQLKKMPRLKILLTNTKVPRSTKVLVAGVRTNYEKFPGVFGPVFEAMHGLSVRSVETYNQMADKADLEHYSTLQDLIDINHQLLRLIGVSHPVLETLVQESSALGVHTKLTGAGGGGCALSLISPDVKDDVIEKLKTVFREKGFDCWETSVGGDGVLLHSNFNTIFTVPKTFRESL
ncbi:mevalonate kinase-like [Liolophura sinensis]|uniref:mevalonate kinase-like n=1 Tax=Liolophura sinensis TaxID=3198878 RepID=UPI00315830D8